MNPISLHQYKSDNLHFTNKNQTLQIGKLFKNFVDLWRKKFLNK